MIQYNKSLRKQNTFGLEVSASKYCEFITLDELKALLDKHYSAQEPLLILGGGSNLLLTSNFEGMVLHPTSQNIEVIKEDENWVWIKVDAGRNWHELVLYTIEKGWGGLENLSLIPGNVGAAPIQNIGAYGVELKDSFSSLEAYELISGTVLKFDGNDCDFGYRNSYFKREGKGKYIILNVTFRLSKKPVFNIEYGAIRETLSEMGIKDLTLKAISDAVIHIRQSKLPDPKEIGNSGSFFKNPTIDKIDFEALKAEFPLIPGYEQARSVKVPAAWLIDQCGWKGYRQGNIGVHDRQALVLVNHGGGLGSEIRDLAFKIQQSVRDRFGIELEPEVNIL